MTKGLRHCGQRTIAIDTRQMEGFIKRRRGCPVCGLRFTTYEVIVSEQDPPKSTNGKKPVTSKYYQLLRRCKECGAELNKSNLIKERDLICADCKTARFEARLELKARRQAARVYLPRPKQERQPFTPPVSKEELAELYRQYPLNTIGPMFNRTGDTIRNWMRFYGLERYPQGNVSCRSHEQILCLQSMGLSVDEIATQVGHKRDTIRKHLGLILKNGRKPIGCPDCVTSPYSRGLCKNCYERNRRRIAEVKRGG